jgi:valyl-tRNA synthetase
MHAGSGSVHRANWPTSLSYADAAQSVDPAVLQWAGQALAELRKIKSEAKVSMKTPILSASLGVPAEGISAVRATLNDIAEAGRATGDLQVVEVSSADGAADGSHEAAISILSSTLGEPPAKKPKH